MFAIHANLVLILLSGGARYGSVMLVQIAQQDAIPIRSPCICNLVTTPIVGTVPDLTPIPHQDHKCFLCRIKTNP